MLIKFRQPTKGQRKRNDEFLSQGEELIVVTSIGNLYFWSNFFSLLPFALLLIGLPKFLQLVRMRNSYKYMLTNRRCIIIRGVFSRRITTAPLDAITHITIEQSFVQRFFYNTGNLIIITAGFDQREILIEDIAHPIKFKILIEELREKLDSQEEKEEKIEKFALRALSG